ncbi:hypothetical protein CPB86DRAFT_424834 [Serendipita vermifera]|nr:hypothetical protein CPB86DRAFT_424834 [Serendipita vermifera]
MDINSLTTSTLPSITAAGLNNSSNPVDAASIVPVVATPPDPTTIPIEPPHGSPRPPVGQLLPDVAAAEDPSSPMKVNTPPPSTPSPTQIQPQPVPLDAYPDQESETTNQANVAVNGHQYQNGVPVSLDHAVDQSDTDMFDQESAKPEADDDMIMDDNHIQNSTNGIAHPEQIANGSYSALPNNVESPSHATEEYDDGPPPAKRQKLESVRNTVTVM